MQLQDGRVNSGESLFLRKLVFGIPAQASGKNLTRPLMPSAPQTSCIRATSPLSSYTRSWLRSNPSNDWTAFRNTFYFVSTYANAPIPTKQRLYAFWGLPALAFALHGWQRAKHSMTLCNGYSLVVTVLLPKTFVMNNGKSSNIIISWPTWLFCIMSNR